MTALIVFFLVYLGMVLGNWPGFALDRTGIALLGAIAFIELQDISLDKVAHYVDIPTIAIIFSFMIISGQFYFSGFYTYIVDRIVKWKLKPQYLLLIVIVLSGTLSAVLLNDIVCLALTPLIIRGCFQKKLNPMPFLLALACSSNIGSALTLIGNPQNLLIGEVLSLSFVAYFKYSLFPCLLGLLICWLVIKWQVKKDWFLESKKSSFETIPFDFWQSTKAIIVIVALLCVFFIFDVKRDHAALIAAGILLLSRKMASKTMLSFIDWQLLVLFIGLFVVNRSFLDAENLNSYSRFLEKYHIDVTQPAWLFFFSIFLSNIVSNVPAVMLLLPFASSEASGSLLAISSTFAGNMFIVGSLANLIVISQAARYGIKIDWKRHFRSGFVISIVTLLLVISWFYLIS